MDFISLNINNNKSKRDPTKCDDLKTFKGRNSKL